MILIFVEKKYVLCLEKELNLYPEMLTVVNYISEIGRRNIFSFSFFFFLIVVVPKFSIISTSYKKKNRYLF